MSSPVTNARVDEIRYLHRCTHDPNNWRDRAIVDLLTAHDQLAQARDLEEHSKTKAQNAHDNMYREWEFMLGKFRKLSALYTSAEKVLEHYQNCHYGPQAPILLAALRAALKALENETAEGEP
jgi:hypothetical protein